MVSLGDGFLLVATLSGAVLCWLGVHCYRRWDEPGAESFAAFALLLGVGSITGPVLVFVGIDPTATAAPRWFEVSLFLWVVAMVPWILFALQYTGRTTRIRRRVVLVLAAPIVGFMSLIAIQATGVAESNIVTQFLGTVALIYTLALLAVGCYLLLRTTAEYGHLSVVQGISLTIAGISPILLLNYIGTITQEFSAATTYGIYSLGFVTPALALSLAVFRYDMFESTPAAGTLGERAIPRETDDLVFVVDRDSRVIKLNRTASETLDISRTGPLGEPFESVAGYSVAELDGKETVEMETAVGQRKFDPQVTSFTDQHGRRLGSLLSLRDVTERELRKQRLEVLNRVLRHNLRNRVDVIKSNAEAVDSDSNTEYVAAIRESADGLATLSSKARATDQLVSRPARQSSGDLSATVRSLADAVGAEAVTLDVPDSAPLVTDWDALRKAIRSALENAVEHTEESVTVSIAEIQRGYEITVADDGPGIPDSELASLDAETETPLQHGTGLGLWQLEWGITKLGGDLSFETDDGTTVRMAVPDHGN
jgi:signal transduction histidine kinase